MSYNLKLKGSYKVRYRGSVLPFSFTSNTVQIVESTTVNAKQINDIAGYVSPVKELNGKLVRLGDFEPIYYGTNSYVFPNAGVYGYPYQLEIFSREYREDFDVSVYQVDVVQEEEPVSSNNLERYITKRIGFLPESIYTPIPLSDVPFGNFLITGVLLNEAPNINTNIDVKILLNGDVYNNFSITYKDHSIPEVPMTSDFSLEVRPTRDATGVVIGIKEVELVEVLG